MTELVREKAQISGPPPEEPYHYEALYECGYRQRLHSNWNRVVETSGVGPYEGYCRRHVHLARIVGFTVKLGERPLPVEEGT